LIEWSWLAISIFALAVTVSNVLDAATSWRAFRGSGRIRETATRANVRREAVRVVICAALVIVILPALARLGDTSLSPYVVIAMLIPAGMALNSYLDRRTRRTVDRMLAVVDGP
jgi:hypothetical protein